MKAISTAADELKPAPMGMLPEKTAFMPGKRLPSSANTQATPSGNFDQPGHVLAFDSFS
jgi:hypothetical protein